MALPFAAENCIPFEKQLLACYWVLAVMGHLDPLVWIMAKLINFMSRTVHRELGPIRSTNHKVRWAQEQFIEK